MKGDFINECFTSLLKRGIRKKSLFQGVSEKMSEETEFIWFLQFDYW
jgi:hypothetical protein